MGDDLTKGSVTVSADHQIDGDVVLKPGSSITLLGTDSWPSLTMVDATALIAGTEILALTGPINVGGTTNSTIRGPVSLGSASRNIIVSNDVELRLAGPISGVNFSLTRPGLIKGGGGTLLLLSNNTFAGNVSITAGRVIAAEPLSLGTPTSEALSVVTGATTVSEGGELLLSAVAITNELVTLSTTTGGLSSTGSCTWAGVMSLLTDVPFNISNSTLAVIGPIVGAGGFVKRGAGTLSLAGTNSFSGASRCEAGLVLLSKPGNGVAIGGDVQIGDGAGGANADILRVQLPEQIVDTATVTLLSSGQLDLNATETVGAVRGAGTIRLDGGDLTLGGNGTDDDLSATILGTFGLTKIGAGVQTLLGVNTYTGPTRVLAGTLRVNGSQASSAVQVIGATLEGRGTAGAVTSNGQTAPGTVGLPGILTCGNLLYQAGGSFAVDLGGETAGTQSDQLAVRGTVQLANAALVPTLLAGYLPASGDTIVILENDGVDAIGGTFQGLAQNGFLSIGAGRRFRVRYDGGDGNDVSLTFTNETVLARNLGVQIGNGNGRLDPNECGLLSGELVNQAGTTLSDVTVEVQPLTGGLTFAEPLLSFATLAPSAVVSFPRTIGLSVGVGVPCGTVLSFRVTLRERGAFVSASTVSFTVGPGGAVGCVDGGGVCSYCPDVVIAGTLRSGDSTQTGTLTGDGTPSACGAEGSCAGLVTTGTRLVDALTFVNGPRTACLTVELENLCADGSSELFATVYSESFTPASLCSRYRADIGDPVSGGKSGRFSFEARRDEVFVVTVNEFKVGQACGQYRLTVRGGDCRPRLAVQTVVNTNIVRVSWPNSAPAWQPQFAPLPSAGAWSDLTVTLTNASGRFYFDTRPSPAIRFFRLREP